MRRRTRTLAVLVAIAAGLAAAVIAEIHHEQASFPKPLLTVNLAHATRLGIHCRSCASRTFEKISGHWIMREPYALPADDAAVARLLAVARTAVRRWSLASDLDLAKIGLAPAEFVLAIDDHSMDAHTIETHTIEIGTTDALDSDRYVRVDSGSQIAHVPDRFSPYLLATPESELDRHLLPRDTTLVAVAINGATRPDRIAAWSQADADSISTPIDQTRVSNPPTEVRLTLRSGTAIDYRIDGSGDGYIATRKLADGSDRELAYRLSETAMQSLLGDRATAKP